MSADRPLTVVSVMTTESSGGAEFAAVELLDAFVARGNRAILLTNKPELRRETAVATRPVDLGPKLSRSTYRRLFARAPRLALRFRRALERECPYDALLVHYKKEQLLTLTLPGSGGPLIVWAEWGPVPFEFRTGPPNWLYRRAAGRADLVLAISNGTRHSLIDAGVPAEKVVVLPNAVRADEIRFTESGRAAVRERLGIPEDAFVVGCVSRFHPKKRNDIVVEAVKALPGAHLILAGSGETEGELRALAASIAERAHFLPTPTSDVAEVYSAFDVSVFCPSPTEGAPRAVILAMFAERAVLSTGAEGVTELLEHGGWIVAPENDSEALAESLTRLRDDPAQRERLGIEGKQQVEQRHAAPVVAERLEVLLRDCLRRRAR